MARIFDRFTGLCLLLASCLGEVLAILLWFAGSDSPWVVPIRILAGCFGLLFFTGATSGWRRVVGRKNVALGDFRRRHVTIEVPQNFALGEASDFEPTAVTNQARAARPVEHTGLRFDDFQWADPPPTRRQFGYAVHLGVELRNWMTLMDVSDAIQDALDATLPATREQLSEIRELHGELPRKITQAEAEQVIEFLSSHHFACPFCGLESHAFDDRCFHCDRSFKKVKIPVYLE